MGKTTHDEKAMELLIDISNKTAAIEQHLKDMNGKVGKLQDFANECPASRGIIHEKINGLEKRWLYGIIGIIVTFVVACIPIAYNLIKG